jgi:hypothetical protein
MQEASVEQLRVPIWLDISNDRRCTPVSTVGIRGNPHLQYFETGWMQKSSGFAMKLDLFTLQAIQIAPPTYTMVHRMSVLTATRTSRLG